MCEPSVLLVACDASASEEGATRPFVSFETLIEQGRALLGRATTLLRIGRNVELAVRDLEAAIEALDIAGADFLAARAELQLAQTRTSSAAFLLRRVERRRNAFLSHTAPTTRKLSFHPPEPETVFVDGALDLEAGAASPTVSSPRGWVH